MTGENSEQRSIADFIEAESSDTRSSDTDIETSPSADDPSELLSWLRKETTPSPASVTDHLPELIDQVQVSGFNAWSAGQCINLILDAVQGPVDCPELISLLGSEHVEPALLIDHLIKIYPRNVPALDDSIRLDRLDIDELSHADRMEAYRLLSRLPPDEAVYSKLKNVAEMFDGAVNLAGTQYPVGGLFHTYATRCLITTLQHHDAVPEKLAERAVGDKPWGALRVAAANPEQVVNVGLDKKLIQTLERTNLPPGFYHGRIILSFCETYLQVEDPATRSSIGGVILAALDAGVSPTCWDKTVPRLINEIRTENGSEQTSKVLTGILDAIQDEELDIEIGSVLQTEMMIEQLSVNQRAWISPLKTIAESWPDLLLDHTEPLVTLAQDQDGRDRTEICELLACIGKASPANVLPVVEPLVCDLERASTGREVDDVGILLQALNVYPSPPQLRALYGSTDESIDSAAKRVAADLRRGFQKSEPALIPGEIDTIQSLSEGYSLVRRTGPLTWESPSLSSFELSLINATAQIATTAAKAEDGRDDRVVALLRELLDEQQLNTDERDASIQFVVPSHDQTWVEFAVLGAMFAQIVNPDLQAVLHTPAINGWGTKKDVRDALQMYGIAPSENKNTEVIPLLDLVPTARVTDGQITVEAAGTTVSDEPPYLTLVRDTEPLSDAPADIVLYNYLPGIGAVDAAHLQQWRGGMTRSSVEESRPPDKNEILIADGHGEVADQASLINLIQIDDVEPSSFEPHHPDHPVHVEIHSIFSTQHAADRRQHIGPPTDLPAPYLIGGSPESNNSQKGQENGLSNARTRAALQLTSGQSSVELRAVQSDADIGELLVKIDEYVDQIGDPDSAGALRSMRYTLGSLPIPVDLHDTWVQNQVDQGNRWVPRRLHERRNGIQTLAEEAVLDAQCLDDSLVTIDTLLDRLAESNPLFEELLAVLDAAAAEKRSVGVLCGKKTYKEMLGIYLRERASNWVLGEDLQLLDEDTVRGLEPDEVDWLVTFDPLPPQTAIYYHHPGVKKTIVLGHADGTLSSRLYRVEQKRRPFLPRRTGAELPELDVSIRGRELEPSESDRSLTDELYRTYLSVAAQSRADDSADGSGSSTGTTKYHVEFEDDQSTILWDAHPVIVRSEEHLVTAGEYVLRPLSRISAGDEIALIDEDSRADLWEEFLREDWKDSDEDVDTEEAFMDAVRLWYDAVLNGLEDHAESDDLATGITDFAREIEPEVSVATDTIVDWARSVYRAESPSDLVFRSGLRIGPQDADGVQAVAEAYGSQRMADNWEQVFTRIKTIRTTHRQRGSVFWEWLADRACGDDLFNQPGVIRTTVTRCRKLD